MKDLKNLIPDEETARELFKPLKDALTYNETGFVNCLNRAGIIRKSALEDAREYYSKHRSSASDFHALQYETLHDLYEKVVQDKKVVSETVIKAREKTDDLIENCETLYPCGYLNKLERNKKEELKQLIQAEREAADKKE
jgi:hypothetical protein